MEKTITLDLEFVEQVLMPALKHLPVDLEVTLASKLQPLIFEANLPENPDLSE